MCYEERLFRSWTAKRARKDEKAQPATERDRPQVEPIHTAPAAETRPRKELERELEEIV